MNGLTSLVYKWREIAKTLDVRSCDAADLEKRDMLYYCAEELDREIDKYASSKQETATVHGDVSPQS